MTVEIENRPSSSPNHALRVPQGWSRFPQLKDLGAVLFDWAGTTVDFGSVAPVRAILWAFEQFGIRVTQSEARQPMGRAKSDHIRALLRLPNIREQYASVDSKVVKMPGRSAFTAYFSRDKNRSWLPTRSP